MTGSASSSDDDSELQGLLHSLAHLVSFDHTAVMCSELACLLGYHDQIH